MVLHKLEAEPLHSFVSDVFAVFRGGFLQGAPVAPLETDSA